MTNHLQVVGIVSGFDLNWPAIIQDTMDTQKSVSSSTDTLFSFDCALSDASSVKIPFTKLMLFFFMPVVFMIPVIIFWCLWGKIKDRSEISVNYMVATIIIMFFLLHPTILKEMMSFFK